MYIDVDGFVSAPSRLHSLQPPADDRMLQSLLPKTPSSLTIGQSRLGATSLAKFRRRVPAYVVDWAAQNLNPIS
ncbi:hypothetical protein NC653_005063 [Populus alba x Populus x berolinensis]|uniref:Uncharacterized protein n=1 Tax=Populus alba x Populus x berolinensis TaxID=444605 RepID=A0AAD6WAS4_9ROSI|nr:hypothetical protein NC653_005063 [Populus alba x Populus x berolinensis]